jgi:hypothetical protein
VLVATGTSGIGPTAIGIILVVVLWVIPFFVAHRIGVRKGRVWFWWPFFFGWLGVLVLALLSSKRTTSGFGSTYHVPPEIARRRRAGARR